MKVFRVIIKERTCSKAEDFPSAKNKHDKELFMPANNIEQIWDYFRSKGTLKSKASSLPMQSGALKRQLSCPV